jgi:hypothetical protein
VEGVAGFTWTGWQTSVEYVLQTAFRYDAVGERLRQEVHQDSDRAADAARGAFAFGPRSLTAFGGGDCDR